MFPYLFANIQSNIIISDGRVKSQFEFNNTHKHFFIVLLYIKYIYRI